MTRSLAEQTTDEMGGPLSVLTRQKHDHVRLQAFLEELEGTTGAEQQAVLQRVCRLVFSHAFAEEAVLWPALRRHLPDGEELTLEVEREHQKINELISALEASRPGDPGREELIDRAVALMRHDVRDEEDVLLPKLQEAVDTTQLRRLGVAWEAVRRTAPTRAHPEVARRPPGNVLAALPLSLVDRTRDLVDEGVRRAPDRARPTLHAVSEGLGVLAHQVEHLPPLRRGEHPDTHRSGRDDGTGGTG